MLFELTSALNIGDIKNELTQYDPAYEQGFLLIVCDSSGRNKSPRKLKLPFSGQGYVLSFVKT